MTPVFFFLAAGDKFWTALKIPNALSCTGTGCNGQLVWSGHQYSFQTAAVPSQEMSISDDNDKLCVFIEGSEIKQVQYYST